MAMTPYTKTKNTLKVNTEVRGVDGFQPRSQVADAAKGIGDIVGAMGNLKQQKMKNESAEMSLQTALWQAEAADINKEVGVRKAAAEKARQARLRDEQQAYLRAKAERDLAYNDGMMTVGDDPAALTALTQEYLADEDAAYSSLSEDSQDKLFNMNLEASTNAQGNYNKGLHNIAVGEFNSRLEMFPVDTQSMGPDQRAETYDQLMAQGQELGLSRTAIGETLVEAQSNYTLATTDYEAAIKNQDYSLYNEQRAQLEQMREADPYLAGKDTFVQAEARLDSVKTALDTRSINRIDNSVTTLDKDGFEESLTIARDNGVITEEEDKQYRLKFTTEWNEKMNDPKLRAARADANLGGRFVPTEVFAGDTKAQTEATKLVEQHINQSLNDPENANPEMLEYHRVNNPELFQKQFNSKFTRTTSRIKTHLAKRPDESDTAAFAEWQQGYGHLLGEMADLERVGGPSLSSKQHGEITTIDVLTRHGREADIPEALNRLSQSGGASPVPKDSNAGKWIIKNVPEDDQFEARVTYSALQEAIGLDDEEIEEILESTHSYTNFRETLRIDGTSRSASWSPKATDVLGSYGIGPEAQAYTQETLVNRDLELFDDDTYNRIDTITAGEDLVVTTDKGYLKLKSSTGTLVLPFNEANAKVFADAVNKTHDEDNISTGTKVRNITSVDTSKEADEVITPRLKEVEADVDNLTVEEVKEKTQAFQGVSEQQAAIGDQLMIDLKDGVEPKVAYDRYLAGSVTNTMKMLRAEHGDSLTPQEYNKIEQGLIKEGKEYLDDNSRVLFGLMTKPWGHPTDGLFKHLSDTGREQSGGKATSEALKTQVELNDKKQELEKAREAAKGTKGNRGVAADKLVKRLESVVDKLEGEVKAAKPKPKRSSSPLKLTVTQGTPEAEAVELTPEQQIATANLKEAEIAVAEAQNTLEQGGKGHQRRNAQANLKRTQAELKERRAAYDKLFK